MFYTPEDLEGHLFHLPDKQEILWDEILNSKNISKDTEIEKEFTSVPEKINLRQQKLKK